MKKLPTRTCIGCGEQKPKKELLRIVKNQAGEIKIDKTSKLEGRGAYICHNTQCLEKLIRSKRLERSFEMKIQENIYQELKQELENEQK